ncbi:MAG: TrkH family potassium uptake protein [Pseudomonadota bacterium]
MTTIYQPFLIGILLSILSVTMIIPVTFSLYYSNSDWKAFLISAFITCFSGVSLVITNKTNMQIGIKEAFLMTTMAWLSLSCFASLPFIFSNQGINIVDALFESVSGITTTGATVFYNLDNMPRGILIWRAILQWLGGIGIIVIAMAVLPMLKIGGMQLFRTESSDRSDKIIMRATQISGTIGLLYLFATFACFICLLLAGLEIFDAIAHALTTVSTGGFSTHDASIGYYDSFTVEAIVAFFMILASIPFILYIQLLNNAKNMKIFDDQVRFFFIVLISSIIIVTYWLYTHNDFDLLQSFRYSFFNIVSILTTGGFASTDYNSWGPSIITFIFMLGVIGGCTGSTSGGIKIFRFIILYQTAKLQVYKLIKPHGIFNANFNGRKISESVKLSVMSFFILFTFCFLILSILLSFTEMDFLTSMSAAASSISNLGPGLGEIIGPAGNYSTVSNAAKWILMFGMILGRLEIFTIFVLLSAIFWEDNKLFNISR